MAHIRMSGVRVEYELLSVRDYNLKRQVLELARRRTEPPPVIHALNGIDLDVPEGSRLGLVGANGAGKSTLLSVMAGLLPPTSGTVDVHGRVLALLGAASAGLDAEASGRDNIITMGVQLGESPAAMKQRIEDVTEFSGLSERIDHSVHTYSSGMQARLRFSILTSLRPDVLLIDEGISMADAEFAERAGERLKEFLSSAGILVLASHGDALIQQQCQTVVWIHHGTIMRSGDVGRVLAEYHGSFEQERAAEEPTAPLEPAAEPTDYVRVVARAYWRMLGRAPDADGLVLHASRLQHGVTLDELEKSLYLCAEAKAARDSWPGDVHLGLSHDIPYATRTRDDAEHLVVTFPGVGTHRYLPEYAEAIVGGLAVHQLAIGMANDRAHSAPDLKTWTWDAGTLIRRTAEHQGVPNRNIICIGHSFQAYFAILAGLSAQAGHIAVGAPPIQLGTCIEQVYLHARSQPSNHVLFESVHKQSGIAVDQTQVAVLDSLVNDAATEADQTAAITMFASPHDIFAPGCRDLAAAVAPKNRLACSVVEGTYPNHVAMGPQYHDFARRYAASVIDCIGAGPAGDEPARSVPAVPPMAGFETVKEDGEPDYPRMVARGYWQVLGRMPDADGLAQGIEHLEAGVSLGQFLVDIEGSSEAQSQRDAWTGEYYLGMAHDIPYSTKHRDRARHLIVTFPGVGTHRYIPASDGSTPEVAAHELALGLSTARPLRHAEMDTWSRDAGELIRQAAVELDVAGSDIICVGHSVKGMGALFVGLLAQAGHIVIGSPSLGGRAVSERVLNSSRTKHAKAGAASLIQFVTAAADPIEHQPAHELIDPMFLDAALDARHEAQLEIFVSRRDLFWPSCQALYKSLVDHPSLTCILTEGDYAGHNAMGPAFDAFLNDRLMSLTGTGGSIDLGETDGDRLGMVAHGVDV